MNDSVSPTCVGSGLDDPDNAGHLGHFLPVQVGLIHKKMIRMWLGWSRELEIWLLVEVRICNSYWICTKEWHSWAWHLNLHLLRFILNWCSTDNQIGIKLEPIWDILVSIGNLDIPIPIAPILQVFAIELVTFAVDFVPLAVQFGAFAVEFVGFAVEFVALALQFVTLAIELDTFAMELGTFALELVTFH